VKSVRKERVRSEREREARDEKIEKFVFCVMPKKNLKKLCLLSTFSREKRERNRLHIFKEETALFCCRLMR